MFCQVKEESGTYGVERVGRIRQLMGRRGEILRRGAALLNEPTVGRTSLRRVHAQRTVRIVAFQL
jgi:hypothetical protein